MRWVVVLPMLAGCFQSFEIAPGPSDAGMPDLGLPDFGTPDTCTRGWRLGEPCARDFDCDDRCICNGPELCVENRCVPAVTAACPPSVPCALATCDEIHACGWVLDPTVCDDHELCNGVEICVPEYGCRRGVTPLCDDGNDCTYDTCTAGGVGCVHSARDDDMDGFVGVACGGTDCNDMPGSGVDVHPGAREICGDNQDDDCSGDWDYDLPICTTPYDSCATALTIDAPGDYQGTTRGNADDYALSCGPGGADVVYHLRLATRQFVMLTNFSVGIHVPAPDMPEAIAVRPWAQCATGPDLRCAMGPTPLPTLPLWAPTARMPIFLGPGEYAVILEHQTPCAYVLRVEW